MRSPAPIRVIISFLFMALIAAACSSSPANPVPIEQGPTPTQVASRAAELAPEPAAVTVTITSTPELPSVVEEDVPLNMEPVSGDIRSEQMRNFVTNLVDEGNFMGSILVAQDGYILLNEGFGLANVGEGIHNLPETQFRIGSLTKQFTAAAVLKLQEQGMLDVKDSVAKYLPDYPLGGDITIHQLLTHTAGIPNYEQRRDLPEVVQSPILLDDLIASFSDQPLDFPPGQGYSYSSSGYVLLTKIIEIVSGQPYADYLEEQIFKPADMANSGYDYLAPDLPFAAVGYQLTPGGPHPAILTDSSWPSGAGALYSTLEDLYRWDRVLYGDDLLSAASRQAFFTPWVDTGQGTDYGYGWDIGRTAGRSSIAHGGGIFGFASFMARFPEDDAVIIVLSNGIQMPPRIVAEGLAGILFSDQ